MTNSSAKNRSSFWSRIAANALICPGAGTWLAGSCIAGGIQIALALFGTALTLAGLGWLVFECLRSGMLSYELVRPCLIAFFAGIIIFIVAFVWSMVSVIRLEKKESPEPPRSSS